MKPVHGNPKIDWKVYRTLTDVTFGEYRAMDDVDDKKAYLLGLTNDEIKNLSADLAAWLYLWYKKEGVPTEKLLNTAFWAGATMIKSEKVRIEFPELIESDARRVREKLVMAYIKSTGLARVISRHIQLNIDNTDRFVKLDGEYKTRAENVGSMQLFPEYEVS